jgi:hypothetical protein
MAYATEAYHAGMGVKRLAHMPPGTIGFRVDGDVEKEDYTETLRPALQAAIDSGRGIRSLYLIEDLDEMEPSALWEDMKLGVDAGIKQRDQWKRSAIVTDIEWMARASKMFLWMIPGGARVFPVAELEAAKAWVAGS